MTILTTKDGVPIFLTSRDEIYKGLVMIVTVGGYLIDAKKGRVQFAALINPNVEALKSRLEEFSNNRSGALVARLEPPAEVGPSRLRLYVDGFKYLLMLEENAEDGEGLVRTLTTSTERGLVPVLGEPYPISAITSDFSLVSQLFMDFVMLGDISREIMRD